MEWKEFISEAKNDENYNKLLEKGVYIPPLVHFSTLIVRTMMKKLGKNNICVLPNINETYPFYYVIDSLIDKVQHTSKSGPIAQKKKNAVYNSLKKGSKVSIGKKIAEFESLELLNDNIYISFKCKDCNFKIPLDNLPDKIKTAPASCSLSNYVPFMNELKRTKEKLPKIKTISKMEGEDLIDAFCLRKSNLNGSIVYVSSLSKTKTEIKDYNFFNKPVRKIINFGKISPSGEIQNLNGYSVLQSTPDILITPDLYSVLMAYEQNISINSIIIDITTIKNINNYIDIIDDFLRKNIPITILTNTKESLTIDEFINRKFNLWRWPQWLIPDNLVKKNIDKKDKIFRKISVYCNKRFYYVITNDIEIDEFMELYQKSKSILLQNENLVEPIKKVLQIFTYKVRSIIYDGKLDVQLITEATKIWNYIKSESRFISDSLQEIIADIILKLIVLLSSNEQRNSKVLAIQKIYQEDNPKKLYVVVPNNVNKNNVYNYLNKIFPKSNNIHNATILYPDEYINYCSNFRSTTIIVGWFNRNTMFSLLNANVSSRIYILLYNHEYKWAKNALKYWRIQSHIDEFDHVLDTIFSETTFNKCNSIKDWNLIFPECNEHIFEQSEKKESITPQSQNKITENHPDDNQFAFLENETNELPDAHIQKIDILSDIDSFIDLEPLNVDLLTNNTTKKLYTSNINPKAFTTLIYSDDTKVTYNNSHKLIVITEIIKKDDGHIYLVPASEVSINDYIVEREKDKDILNLIVSKLLSISNLNEAEETANIWKVKIQDLGLSENELFDKLKAIGCNRNKITIHNWLSNSSMITPQSLSDLQYIAKIVNDTDFNNQINQIFESGKLIKIAHKKAGRYLSNLLKLKLKDGSINFNDSFDSKKVQQIKIEDIGTINIRKIKDIIANKSE